MTKESCEEMQNRSGPRGLLWETHECLTGKHDLLLELFSMEMTVEVRHKKLIQVSLA